MRHQFFVAERFLETAFSAYGQNGILAGFSAGSRRCRYGYKWKRRPRIRLSAADSFQVFHDGMAQGKQTGNGLRGIHRAASANRQNGIGLKRPVFEHRFVHQRGRRLTFHLKALYIE